MFTIGQAAQLTGVPEHTLRAWERRYGVFRPARTPGGYRTYDQEAIDAIVAMRRLVEAGRSPREASASLAGQPGARRPSGDVPGVERLVTALGALDAATAKQVIDEQFALRSFESVVDDWLMPALVRVGQAWADGTVSVAGEHLMANITMRRLAAAFDAVGPNPPSAPAIVGAPSGVSHELGLLAFAVALRRAGVAVLYLGAEVPAKAWSDAIVGAGAAVSVTSIPRRQDVQRVIALTDRLHQDHPGVPVAVGGGFQHLAPSYCHRLGQRIAVAAAGVASMLS